MDVELARRHVAEGIPLRVLPTDDAQAVRAHPAAGVAESANRREPFSPLRRHRLDDRK